MHKNEFRVNLTLINHATMVYELKARTTKTHRSTGSLGKFFVTRTDYTLSPYSPGFVHFLVVTLILHFFNISHECFSLLARIIPFLGTRPNLTFFGTHTDSTIFRFSPRKFFVTRTDYTLSLYLPGFDHFPILKLILPFFGTCSDSYSIPARILSLTGSRRDSIIFQSSH